MIFKPAWREKQVWTFRDDKFSVVIQHFTEMPCAEKASCDGGNRWNVYAYVFKTHPHFKNFSGNSMFQAAALEMPIHGHSFFEAHCDALDEVTSIQVGGDYNHLHDEPYTYLGVDDFCVIERDAIELIKWLIEYQQS